jgi:hypothetical protein
MIKPSIPDDEVERLRALRELEIPETEEERVFDGHAGLAACVCNTRSL